MKKKIVCLFICVTIIEMLVGDWREGERRSGGRREHPSSPAGPTPSPNHRKTITNKIHQSNLTITTERTPVVTRPNPKFQSQKNQHQ